MQMDQFQDPTVDRRRAGRYQRINGGDQTRRVWLKKVHGRVKGLKLSRARKLNWKPFSIMFVLSRKIGSFVERMKVDEACPAIVFSCQWGIPVLSHSSVSSRKNSMSCYRGLSWF